MKSHNTQNTQPNIEEENWGTDPIQCQALLSSYSKQVSVLKDQWDKIERPEIDPRKCS